MLKSSCAVWRILYWGRASLLFRGALGLVCDSPLLLYRPRMLLANTFRQRLLSEDVSLVSKSFSLCFDLADSKNIRQLHHRGGYTRVFPGGRWLLSTALARTQNDRVLIVFYWFDLKTAVWSDDSPSTLYPSLRHIVEAGRARDPGVLDVLENIRFQLHLDEAKAVIAVKAVTSEHRFNVPLSKFVVLEFFWEEGHVREHTLVTEKRDSDVVDWALRGDNVHVCYHTAYLLWDFKSPISLLLRFTHTRFPIPLAMHLLQGGNASLTVSSDIPEGILFATITHDDDFSHILVNMQIHAHPSLAGYQFLGIQPWSRVISHRENLHDRFVVRANSGTGAEQNVDVFLVERYQSDPYLTVGIWDGLSKFFEEPVIDPHEDEGSLVAFRREVQIEGRSSSARFCSLDITCQTSRLPLPLDSEQSGTLKICSPFCGVAGFFSAIAASENGGMVKFYIFYPEISDAELIRNGAMVPP
ncbi:uncharacterized protein EI90DRAFT_2090010 [Cantharellus anzutake]|uniref:uncharacterized protein n=1 Tax=Cantharellus anzutake TaxID=1750568 RepID=UPI001904F7AB|nr:uncharacterized protein EI90DRAFT_2090010 [Cantharellus anzutake]KAF8340626.1 hypothetical protein EI90DRAFT_2090010 [Cantharellus anzutake]